jgi:predicted nucleic acid-binding protein
MELISDASVIIASLSGSKTTIKLLLSKSLELYAPEYLLEEIEEHKLRVKTLSKLSTEEFNKLFKKLKSKITFISKRQFDMFLTKANELISDKDDTEYLALSLSRHNTPIWSNDPGFKEQLIVEVFTTSELLKHLSSHLSNTKKE